MIGRKVLLAIADIQLKALTNLYEHRDEVDKDLIFRYVESVSEEYGRSINRVIDVYQQFFTSRFSEKYVELLSEYQLDICIHILFRMEDQWLKQFSQREINSAWNILFKAKEKFHPEFRLTGLVNG